MLLKQARQQINQKEFCEHAINKILLKETEEHFNILWYYMQFINFMTQKKSYTGDFFK